MDAVGGYRRPGPFIMPMDDILRRQRKGQYLTTDEKERVKKYSEERRQKNKAKR